MHEHHDDRPTLADVAHLPATMPDAPTSGPLLDALAESIAIIANLTTRKA